MNCVTVLPHNTQENKIVWMIHDLQFTKSAHFMLQWTSHRSSKRKVYENSSTTWIAQNYCNKRKKPDNYRTLEERLQDDVGTCLRFSITKYPEQDG